MKLHQLGARFVEYVTDGPKVFHVEVDDFAEAQGVSLRCPRCMGNQRGNFAGVHSITCWGPRVPAAATPGPGRYAMTGTSMDDLTLSMPVQLYYGCRATFRVDKGEVSTCT